MTVAEQERENDRPRLRQGTVLIVCPDCGGRCYARGGTATHSYYYCENVTCSYSRKVARPTDTRDAG